jgi:thiol-disulfide isomerase/thioredoxin
MGRIIIIAGLFLAAIVTNAQEIKRIKITDLEKTIAENKGPMIINFWATWCKPCVEEIPYFQEEVQKNTADSLQLILVSLDLEDYYPQKIMEFATKRKFTAPIYWLDEFNADYFCPKVDSAWSGAIPSSLFINPKTGYRKFREEQLSVEKLQKEIRAMLSKPD